MGKHGKCHGSNRSQIDLGFLRMADLGGRIQTGGWGLDGGEAARVEVVDV